LSGLGHGEVSLESLGQGDFSQSVLSSELSSTGIETDNPFADTSGSPLQSQGHHAFQEFSGSPLRHTGNSNHNTAFSDEPKGMSVPSGSWKLPRCLSRSSSQVAAESSPLRWCVPCTDTRMLLLPFTCNPCPRLCPLRALVFTERAWHVSSRAGYSILRSPLRRYCERCLSPVDYRKHFCCSRCCPAEESPAMLVLFHSSCHKTYSISRFVRLSQHECFAKKVF
jgi:hypothetical protein